jgi:hypothetical protein
MNKNISPLVYMTAKKIKLVMFIFQQPLAQRGFALRGLYSKPVKINIGETIAER